MALTSQKISWCFRVMKENRNDITVLWDNSFYISIDCSGPYLQNVCWILVFRLLENAFVSQILLLPSHETLPQFLTLTPRQRQITLTPPRHHFSENLSLSQKEGGEGNYAEKAIMKPYLGTILAIVFGTNILS